jgi:acyl-coenzyme A thioesterase PaaI-like protein
MKILEIPFHQHLSLIPSEKSEYIFQLKEKPEHLNHLGTIHACVQLTLAEASSGEFLRLQFQEIQDQLIPVVRKTEAKYQRPAQGILRAKASFIEHEKEEYIRILNEKKRVIIPVRVEIIDENDVKNLTVVFDWFITQHP